MSTASMQRCRLEITLEAPAVIGDGLLRGQTRSSRNWIPGETIIGALAGAALRDTDGSNGLPAGFIDTFRHGRFGPAMAEDTVRDPLSLVACKYQPKPECRTDSRIDLAWQPDDLDPHTLSCPACNGGLEEAKGAVHGVDLEARMHVELTDQEQAADQNLFRRESLPAHTRLNAVAFLPEAMLGRHLVRVGGAGSVQGAATIVISRRSEPQTFSSAVSTRLDQDRRIVVRLESPAILVDGWGRPALRIGDWAWELESSFAGLGPRVVRQWVRWGEIGGWQSGGLPKPVERTAAPGSVFVIEFDTAPDAERLRAFTDRGLGLRTKQGYGWVDLEPWQDRAPAPDPPLPPESTGQPGTAGDAIAFAAAHPQLTSQVINVLRELEGRSETEIGIRPSLLRRQWFKRLTAGSQEDLIRALESTAEPGRVRRRLEDLVRTQQRSDV